LAIGPHGTEAFEHKEWILTLPVTIGIEGKQRRIMQYVALTKEETGSAPRALVLSLDAGAAGPLEGAKSPDAEQGDENIHPRAGCAHQRHNFWVFALPDPIVGRGEQQPAPVERSRKRD
jgi:hypothetical protein